VTGFDEFFHEEYDRVVRALTLVFDDRDRAEDLAQFAFARAYREWQRVSEMTDRVGWVFAVWVPRTQPESRLRP
jgi:predicted RNA polymerase sigma factor